MPPPRTLGELQLYRVLAHANLLPYYEAFVQQGGDDVQQLCEAGEDEFLEIMALVGMATKPLHVRRLQKALRDWVASPVLFGRTLPSGAVAAGAVRRSPSNGQPGSPGDREERTSLTPLQSVSPKSSMASPQPSDGHPRDQPSSANPHWPGADPERRGAAGAWSGAEEDPSDSPCPPSDPETARAVREGVGRLLGSVARGNNPGEVKRLLRLNKKMAKTVGHIFQLDPHDPAKEEEIRKYSLIYGRFDSKRTEGKQLTTHEMIINEAAAQFCIHDNALLLRRVELFSLARQVAREYAYTSTLKNTSTSDSDLPPQKRLKTEVKVCTSTTHNLLEGLSAGSEVKGQDELQSGQDEDSLSGDGVAGLPQGVCSQSCHSSSPCSTSDPTGPAPWSRSLMKQTLMDEGLRLARLVSRGHKGKVKPETESEGDEAPERVPSAEPPHHDDSSSTKDETTTA